MNRRDAITIEIPNLNNKGLSDLLDSIQGECVVMDIQPNYKKYNIFWFDEVPKELFQFSKDFDWLRNANGQSGNKKLYLNGEILTTENYRTPVYVESVDEGMILDHYEFADWTLITDVAPVAAEETVNLVE